VIRKEILAKEMTQGAVPIGIPAAYKYDAAYAEAAAAKAADTIRQIDREGQIYVDRAAAQAAAAATSAEAAAKIVDVGVDPTLTVSGAAADAKVVGGRFAFYKVLSDTADVNDSRRLDVEINRAVAAEKSIMDSITLNAEGIRTLNAKLANSIALKDVDLMDENGNHITDENDVCIANETWLPVTDTTLTQQNIPADALTVGDEISYIKSHIGKREPTFLSQYKKYELPILYLYDDGAIEDLKSKEDGTLSNSVTYIFPKYKAMGLLSKVKIQGASSQSYPKKNYTLTFPYSFEAIPGWGCHKKYVIKANFVDLTQAKNNGCAKLWGEIRKSRIQSNRTTLVDESLHNVTDENENTIVMESDPMLSVGINYGAVDGFPIMVVINDKYWGLYAFNIPKDDYMAKMGGGDNEAIISCGNYSSTNAEYFKALATMQPDSEGRYDFELEYVSDEDEDEWVLTSLNRMIESVINSTGISYKDTCSQYIDVDSAMDYFIHLVLLGNQDGIGNNYLLDTYDGVKWYFNAYDLDETFGNWNVWSDQWFYAPETTPFANAQNKHRMFHLIYTYDKEAFVQRYRQLRETVLSESYVAYVISSYILRIPKAAHDYECIRWPEMKMTYATNINQMFNWYRTRCMACDAEINNLLN